MLEPGSPVRRFTLLDGMILMAALALALAARSYDPSEIASRFLIIPEGYRSTWVGWLSIALRRSPEALAFAGVLLNAAVPFLAMGTLAFLAVRLRCPRPPRKELVRQPGLIAGVAAVTGWTLASWLPDHSLTFSSVGLTVGASWLILALSGQWRAERSWVDRFGRAWGVLWLATVPWLFWITFHR